MSEYIEVSAKTVEEAITEACVKLGLTSDRLEYEVVEKGSAGFLGIGNKPAVIKAREKGGEEESFETVSSDKKEIESTGEAEKPEKREKSEKKSSRLSEESVAKFDQSAREFITNVCKAMEIEVQIDTKYDADNNCLDIELSGKEMGVIIGKRGQTLDSLQYLTKLAINNNTEEKIKVKVDTEDYRSRRKKTLENLAGNVAYKVKKTGRPVELEPMNPFERRIIHSALQNNRYVKTQSEGEEPDRYVVVSPK